LSESSQDSDPLKEYVTPQHSSSFTNTMQIRIVVDTHQDEKPNKKKKKHRGYAFVVFEREKDMRGKT